MVTAFMICYFPRIIVIIFNNFNFLEAKTNEEKLKKM